MAIKRERGTVESSDSDDDDTGDDSVSGDAWASRAGNSKTARTDVAVDYSVASSSQSTVSRSANTPRRHTGPRKPRVHEKVS